MDTTPSTVRIRTGEDLLAAIPYLIGFQPEHSMVLVLTTHGRPLAVMRFDLFDAAAPADALDGLAGWAALHDVGRALLVGYGAADPVAHTARTAITALHGAGVPAELVARVDNGRYWQFDDDQQVIDPDGAPLDPAASPVAAAFVAAGKVALPDRATLAAAVAPVDGTARDRMVAATAAARIRVAGLVAAADAARGPATTEPDAPVGEALLVLDRLEQQYTDGAAVADADVAALTVLLDLPAVRDVAAMRTGRQPWQVAMWADVTRRAEPEFRAVPATLLALCALQAGNGAVANIAVARARADDPELRLAQLVEHSMALGISPEELADFLHG